MKLYLDSMLMHRAGTGEWTGWWRSFAEQDPSTAQQAFDFEGWAQEWGGFVEGRHLPFGAQGAHFTAARLPSPFCAGFGGPLANKHVKPYAGGRFGQCAAIPPLVPALNTGLH